jgi:hypothetical protein
MQTKPDKFSQFKAQALADCLEQIEAGASMESALEAYEELAEVLRPLVETAIANRAYASSLQPTQMAAARSKEKFLGAAQAQVKRSKTGWLAELLFPRLVIAAAAIILVILIGGMSTAAAFAQALPGDLLYPVKLAAEQTRLFLTTDPIARLKLEQTYDNRRADELLALQKANRSATVRLAGEVRSIQTEMWDVRGVTVALHPGTQLEDGIDIGFYVEVTGLLQANGDVRADTIRARKIEFNGTVESIGDQDWVIDGLSIKVTARTQWIGNPGLDDAVSVSAFVLADGSLQAQRIQLAGAAEAASTWTSTPSSTTTTTLTSTPQPTATQAPEKTITKASATPDRDDDRSRSNNNRNDNGNDNENDNNDNDNDDNDDDDDNDNDDD